MGLWRGDEYLEGYIEWIMMERGKDKKRGIKMNGKKINGRLIETKSKPKISYEYICKRLN